MVNLKGMNLWKWQENILMAYAIVFGIGAILLAVIGRYITATIFAVYSCYQGYRGIKLFLIRNKADEKEV